MASTQGRGKGSVFPRGRKPFDLRQRLMDEIAPNWRAPPGQALSGLELDGPLFFRALQANPHVNSLFRELEGRAIAGDIPRQHALNLARSFFNSCFAHTMAPGRREEWRKLAKRIRAPFRQGGGRVRRWRPGMKRVRGRSPQVQRAIIPRVVEVVSRNYSGGRYGLDFYGDWYKLYYSRKGARFAFPISTRKGPQDYFDLRRELFERRRFSGFPFAKSEKKLKGNRFLKLLLRSKGVGAAVGKLEEMVEKGEIHRSSAVSAAEKLLAEYAKFIWRQSRSDKTGFLHSAFRQGLLKNSKEVAELYGYPFVSAVVQKKLASVGPSKLRPTPRQKVRKRGFDEFRKEEFAAIHEDKNRRHTLKVIVQGDEAHVEAI